MASSSVALASVIVDRGGRPWSVEELVELTSRAMADEASALTTLETSFDARQSWWDGITDSVAEQAEESLIKASATKEFWRLAARRRLERTRTELAGPSPTPLVRLAARNAALCSLEADLAHRSSAEMLAKNAVPTEALQRWLDRADARFRKALKTLADLQRLPIPVLQVNVGGQQVNIATGQVNLPSLAGMAGPTTAADSPAPAPESPTIESPSQKGARSRGRRPPADVATKELCKGLPSPSDPAGAAPGWPDESVLSECPTSGMSGEAIPAGDSSPRPGAPPAGRDRTAQRRGPARRDRRGTDSRRAVPRGASEPASVEHDALKRDELPALTRGRRTVDRPGRTRGPPLQTSGLDRRR